MITDNAVSSDRVSIQAPAALVWEILLDFESYGTWNTFCPQIQCASLKPGSPVNMMVDLGNGLVNQVEYIARFEPQSCIAWRMANKPGDPVHAIRSQYVEPVDEDSCVYWTIDEFSGPQMAAMMTQMAQAVEDGFNRCAYDLKARAEKLSA